MAAMNENGCRRSAGRRARRRPAKLVMVGFMCAGKSTAACGERRRAGRRVRGHDAEIERGWESRSRASSTARARQAFRELEEEVVLELLGGDRTRRRGARRRRRRASRRARRARRPRLRVRGRRRRHGVGPSRAARTSGRWRATATRSSACYALAPPAVRVGRARRRAGRPEPRRECAPCGRAAALREPGVPRSVRMLWADVGPGHPVWVGAGVLRRRGRAAPGRGRCFVVADETAHALHGEQARGRARTASPIGGDRARPAGRAHKTLAEAERVLRELARAGMQRSDTSSRFGGGVVGDLGGLLRGDLPARRRGGARADDARGPGGLRVRRQDRRRPSGGQELRRRVPPAGRGADRPRLLATLPEEELRAGFAEIDQDRR